MGQPLTVKKEPKNVGTDIAVGVGDAEAAKKRRDQLIEGTRMTETVVGRPAGGGFMQAGTVPYGGPGAVGPVQGIVSQKDVDTKRTRELRRQKEDAEMSRINREIDLTRGRERGEMDFYDGALGRVDEATSAEMQQLQDARMDIAEKGFGAQAFQAQREQRLDALRRNEELQNRQLRGLQGATGVQGGVAGLQQLQLMDQQQSSRQDAERQLFLDEVGQKQQALGLAEQTVRGNEADTLARQQYNLAQRKGEIMGRITASYGEAALGVAERTAAASMQAAKEYASAVKAQGGGKK